MCVASLVATGDVRIPTVHIPNNLGRIATPILIAAVFTLSRRYLPATPMETVTEHDVQHFPRMQWFVGGAMIGTGLVFGVVTYEMLVWANRLLASNEPSPLFLLLPERAMWACLPVFGALCLMWEMTLRLWRLFGDASQAQKYERWSNDKAGFDATRLLRLMTIVLGIPATILTVMALPIHTSITQTGLSVGHFGNLTPRYHSYSDVREITVTEGLRTRNGSLQKRPSIVLDFADGTRWSSADNRPIEKLVDSSLLSFLRSKTGLSVSYIDAFPFGAA